MVAPTPDLFLALDAAAFAVPSTIDRVPIQYRRATIASTGRAGVRAIYESPARNEHWTGLAVDTGEEARVYAVKAGPLGTGYQEQYVAPIVALQAFLPLLRVVVARVGPFALPHTGSKLTLTGSVEGVLAQGDFPEPFMLRRLLQRCVLAG